MHDIAPSSVRRLFGSARCSLDTGVSISLFSTPPAVRRSGSPRSTPLLLACSPITGLMLRTSATSRTSTGPRCRRWTSFCGGFPCQDVSTVGKGAGLAPGTRSGLWLYMATAIEALNELVVIENVRGLLSEMWPNRRRNPHPMTTATPAMQPPTQRPPFAVWNPTRGCWETSQRDLFGRTARYWAIWPTSGSMRNGLAYRHHWSVHRITGSASSSQPTPKALFRTPLASDSSRGGETLDQVRARRGTIALSHQIIELACTGRLARRPGGTSRRPCSPWSRASSSLGAILRRHRPMGVHHRTECSLPLRF